MIEKTPEAIAISPDAGAVIPAYFNVVWGYISLARPTEAEQALRQAIAHMDSSDAVADAYHIAYLKGDVAAMELQVTLARGKPEREDWMSNLQALVLARAARLEAARQSARHAIELALAAGHRERAAVWEMAAAVADAWYGNASSARRSALHVLEVAKGRHVTYAAALALAIAGDRARAQAIAAALDRRFPEDTSVRFTYLPTLHALAALSANDPSRALELLRPAATY